MQDAPAPAYDSRNAVQFVFVLDGFSVAATYQRGNFLGPETQRPEPRNVGRDIDGRVFHIAVVRL